MLRLFTIAVAFALGLTLAPLSAEAACLAFTRAPKKFQGMDLILNRRFDKRSHGVVLKYGGKGQLLSVFKYAKRRDRITDETLAEQLDGAAGAIESAARQRGDDILARDKLDDWWVKDVVFQGRTLTATYRQYDTQAFEYVGLSHKRGCLFKVRYTNAKDGNERLAAKRFKWYVREAVAQFR
jgi:hypothetical protein